MDFLKCDHMIIFNKNSESIGTVIKKLSIGKFYFGKPRWQWKRPFFKEELQISFNNRLNPHIIIVGESGSGKSNACKIIMRSIVANGIKVAILDPHSEYLGAADAMPAEIYDAASNGINIFDLDGLTEKEKTNDLTNMFKRIFKLGDLQSYVLYKCILYTYRIMSAKGRTPNIHDLLFSLNVFRKNAKAGELRIIEGIERRLSLIDTGAFSKSTNMDKVFASNSVFVLANLHTNEAQSVYIEGFLRKLYSKMLTMEKSKETRLYLVIDESEKLGQRSIIGKIAAEGRKYGIGIIAIAQRIKSINKDLRSNASMIISFYQREPEELNYLANLISGGNELNRFMEVKRAIRGLHPGNALILDSEQHELLVGKFELNSGNESSLAYELIRHSKTGIHSAELIAIMESKGFHKDETEKKINLLIDSGNLQQYRFELGTKYDGSWYISMPHNSPEHDICVSVISKHLDSLKIRNSIYNNSYGPDVIAYVSNMRVAIEYETGSKDIMSTSYMLEQRAKVYPMTFVIVNDKQVSKYEGIKNAFVFVFSEFLKATELNENSAPNQ